MRKWTFWAIFMAAMASPALAACPNKCSGHGSCKANDVCNCMQNWIGGDCSLRQCPYTRAWSDTAASADDAHYYAECGNRGTCDREKGVCECDAGYTGSGCRRMACPDDCSGHGTCEFIEEMAVDTFDKRIGGASGNTYTTGWDREKIMGCKCDPGFEGHNCASRVCPKGDDPLTTGQNDMVQVIKLTTSTKAFLTYFDPYGNAFTTKSLDFTTGADKAARCTKIQDALRGLPNNVLNNVIVTNVGTTYLLTRATRTSTSVDVGPADTEGAATNVYCQVSFPSGPGTTGFQHLLACDVSTRDTIGSQPLSAGASTCTVAEAYPLSNGANVASTTITLPLSELTECSGRGTCDGATGTCKCFAGHMGLACETQEALV